MKILSRTAVSALVMASLLLVPVSAAAQQAGRIAGRVVTTDGSPVGGVKVTISAPVLNHEIVKTTNKKGKFTVSHSDAAATYTYTFEKEGFQKLVLEVHPPVGGTESREFQLLPATSASAQGSDGESEGGDPAVRAYNEGVEAQHRGELESAAERYREAAKLDPELAAAHTSLAAVLLLGEDYSAAAQEAEAALAIDPGDVRAMQVRFDAYRLTGNKDKADEAAQALREVGGLEEAAARIFNEGVDAYKAEDLETARSKFQEAAQLAPDMVQAHLALARISLAQGNPAEALEVAQSVLERNPENVQALKIAYDGARLTGDTEEAQRILDQLSELDPTWVTTALLEHATKLFNDGLTDVAIRELEAVIEVDPELAKAHFLLGMALFNTGSVDEGRAHLQTFVELAPDDPDAEIARGVLGFEE